MEYSNVSRYCLYSHVKVVNKPLNHSYQHSFTIFSLLERNYSIKHACPHCKIQEHAATHHDHFLVCSASEKNKLSRIAKLTACLTLQDTPKAIAAIIIRWIKSFYYESIQTPLTQLSPKLLNIQQHQDAIGWDHFARGRISRQLKEYMEMFYHQTNSKIKFHLMDQLPN